VGVIQSPGTVEKLRRFFKVRTPYSPDLAEELVPVVVAEDLTGAGVADQGYPREAMGFVNLAAGGAGTNASLYWIPTGAGIVAQLHTIYFSNSLGSVNSQVQVRILNRAFPALGLAAVTSKGFTEGRVTATPNVFLGTKVPLTAALEGSLIGRLNHLADQSIPIPVNFVSANGGGVVLVNNITNLGLAATFLWTEYLLEET